ncbi:RING finger and WD repeat domain-containing protein 3 [Coemansia sp. Benny D160-2]|nr:RING finger and WD repeat domain-containing protein 3 [Coemansia sp. Benny D160-2]
MEHGGVATSSPAARSARGLEELEEGEEEEEGEREQLVWERIPMQRNSESAMSTEWAESEAGAGGDTDDGDGAQPNSRQAPQLQRARSAECTSGSVAGAAAKRQRLAHAASEGEVDDDFAERPRPAPPVAMPPVPPIPSAQQQQEAEADDERSTCPVCMERWTTGGATRVVSLRCGHLFCKRCIARWMRRAAQTRRRARCPECAQPVGKGDVRPIYARSISVVDGEQLQRAQSESRRLAERAAELQVQLGMLETRYAAMCANSSRLGAELAETADRAAWLEAENAALAARLAEKRGGGSAGNQNENDDGQKDASDDDSDSDSAFRPVVRLRATHRSPAADGAMRRLTLHPHTHTAYATYSRRALQLHTLAQIDIHETRAAPLVLPPLHSAEIRAAEPSPHAAAPRYMLTASTDRTAAVVALAGGAPNVAARLALPAPAWSCAWDPAAPALCYVGAARGLVLAFDLRHTARALHVWDGPRHGAAAVDFSPVASIAAVPSGAGATRLVVANAAHAYALPPPDADADPWIQLTPDAAAPRRACFALSYDAALGCVAASFRSAAALEHELYAAGFASAAPPAPDAWRLRQRLAVASRQTMWARPALFSYVDAQRVRRGLFCAGVEASQTLRAWDAGAPGPAPRVLLDLPHDAGPVLDVRGFQWAPGGQTVLATLTQAAVRIYDVR